VRAVGLLALLALLWAANAPPADAAPAASGTVVVRAGVDAALMPPMIAFRLRDGAGRPLTPTGDGADVLADLPVIAVLDTGASAHLLSHDTAARYGVRIESGARWIETGMTGEHALGVTTPYSLSVETGGDDDGTSRRRRPPPVVLSSQRILVNDVPATTEAMLTSPGAIVDVVGMPALEHAVVELRPGGGGLAPAAVSLLSEGDDARATCWLPLALVDFSRRHHPKNRGTPPTLASNPMLRGVRVVHDGRSVRGDWLVDTGSAVTILSTEAAHALGLSDPAPLSAPVGGISGSQKALQGWHVDRIELTTTTGGIVALTDAAVFVHDVSTTTDDGARITLDGIFGANLLDAFSRVVIDIPHSRIGIDVR
jgi:hypothetical protein